MTDSPFRLLRLLVLVSLTVPLGAQSLASRIDARLDAEGLTRHLWGVAVTDLDGRLLFGRNSERLFMPASNTKLVAASAALVMLGTEFRVRTAVYATGPVVDGVLQGDLVLYGRGDPTFSRRCYGVDEDRPGACDTDPAAKFRDLARQLAERGIRQVAGDLIGDGSHFGRELVHPAWEQYDLNWWYAAPVSGLSFNDNAVDLRIEASDTVGAQPRITLSPDVDLATVDNRAVIGPAGSERTFDIIRSSDGLSYLATGNIPAGSPARTEYAAVLDPNRFAALALRKELTQAGIVVRGEVRSTVDSLDFSHARSGRPLADVASRPLGEWVFPVLNSSQNLFAEILLRQLGRHLGTDGSWQQGKEIEGRFLIDSVGVDSTQFALSDGSGLAGNNLVSPAAFTKILAWMRRHPSYDAFAAALPQSGERGSLRRRFVGTALEGRVRAKTGSIGRVNTLSGYVERSDGRVLVFSIQANHHTLGSSRMIPAIDSVVLEMAR